MKMYLHVFVMLLLSFIGYAQLHSLEKDKNATKMLVDGKPFLILGGELHNSSGTDTLQLKQTFKDLKALNLNTVLGYAYWEMVEPKEGVYNFDLVDALIEGARSEGLKVILVWFGSWKSTASSYVPEWVKTNPKRFQRYTLEDGSTLEMLSPFYEENRNADAKAYIALMQHIKETDKDHTVIMMQVENEPGCFENYRDYSPAGKKAWNSEMPKEMVSYLKLHKGKLFPALETAWKTNGYKTKGTWEEILGKSVEEGDHKYYTEELFMAFHYSQFVNNIAEQGKQILNLPAFCNGWLYNPSGFYPHGTVNPHVLDAYRAGGSALDFYSPNVYTLEYDRLFSDYTLGGNTLFIPESLMVPAGTIYSIAEYNSIGFAPFGIDGQRGLHSEDQENVKVLQATNKALSGMMGLVTEHYGKPSMKGVYLYPLRKEQQITIGDYVLKAKSSRVGGFSIDFGKSLEQAGKPAFPMPATADGEDEAMPAGPFGPLPKNIGSAMVIQDAPNEFYILGYGVKFGFELKENIHFDHLGFLSIEEGYFENDRFIATKRWNGDELKVVLPAEKLTTLKVKLYHF
ncbi:DUF5597 domain-containing protein [Maribacter sp. CXY002]|uniref:GH35 family beta-galactosidase n=1 Tax=Maribacter luteocoastalis TaxID=3407671 RepID=UPI003B6790FA